ncbi:trimeric intracellular cation channel family protein [Pseudomonas sp. CGJS7]|uniref:trimeric intracellular cation channel family protein n=1 Tax=Pseudomonas sp. CGJS7 TaxID=3109348 RepID=UPI00300A22EA
MLLQIIYLIAISAEAMTGALSAGRRRMDLFGVVIIASVTALGGGSLRDIVLGHYPLGWVRHPEYLAYTIGAAIAATFLAKKLHYLRRAFLWLDALGLIAFTLIGCTVAREGGHQPAIVVIAGMLTGAFGGVLRDVLCNEIPLVFQRELYAVISLLTGVAYLLLLRLGVAENAAMLACLGAGFAFRLLAIRYEWEMPKFVYQ